MAKRSTIVGSSKTMKSLADGSPLHPRSMRRAQPSAGAPDRCAGVEGDKSRIARRSDAVGLVVTDSLSTATAQTALAPSEADGHLLPQALFALTSDRHRAGTIRGGLATGANILR